MDSTVQVADHEPVSEFMQEIINTELIPLDIGFEANKTFKSPISLVYEIARKRKLGVCFKLIDERGFPHLRVFLTECRVGDLITLEEGISKADSKRRAAEKMLKKLNTLKSLANTASLASIKRKKAKYKKKLANRRKVSSPSYHIEENNPVTRLNLIQHAKQQEPVNYTISAKRGTTRHPEFVMEASIKGHISTGVGLNKRTAKLNAAKALLSSLGYITSPVAGASQEIHFARGGSKPSTCTSTNEENSLGTNFEEFLSSMQAISITGDM